MATDEVLFDEIRVELQQLCTELDRVRAVTEEIPGKSISEKQELNCTTDTIRSATKQMRHG